MMSVLIPEHCNCASSLFPSLFFSVAFVIAAFTVSTVGLINFSYGRVCFPFMARVCIRKTGFTLVLFVVMIRDTEVGPSNWAIKIGVCVVKSEIVMWFSLDIFECFTLQKNGSGVLALWVGFYMQGEAMGVQ